VATFILTVLGDDRPGLVSALSAPINAHGASWERSQMSQLAGKFAGIVVVAVPDERYDALVADLTALEAEGLQVALERTDEPLARDRLELRLELLGADRPGIVAEISASLAAHNVSIEELTTDVHEAPMAGGTLFEARARLVAPPTASTDELRAMLEGLADELMVDLTLSDGSSDSGAPASRP
jgi:glycine cleavage system regulatory protein